MPIPRRRPIHIAILSEANLAYVDSDGILKDVHLNDTIKIINSLQKLFVFDLINITLTLGMYDQLHYYSNRKYFKTMAQVITPAEMKYAICIVSEELEDSSFNKHNKEDWTDNGVRNEDTKDLGLGVITIKDWKMYSPPSTKLEQYLAYLILCESFCIVSRHHIEHSERKFCLFDLCHDKRDLITSIMRSYIHEKCIEDLITYGFNEEDIDEANKILDYVKKPNMGSIVLKMLGDPRVSILLGIAIGIGINFLTNNLVISVIIIFVALLLAAILIFIQTKKVSPKKHK